MSNSTEPEVLDVNSIKVSTPDGTMFFNIVEQHKKPCKVDIIIGKAGSSIQAWSQALARLITISLRNGVSIGRIAEEMAGINSDRIKHNGDKIIRSVPAAINYAILIYLASKNPNPLERRKHRRGPTLFGEEV